MKFTLIEAESMATALAVLAGGQPEPFTVEDAGITHSKRFGQKLVHTLSADPGVDAAHLFAAATISADLANTTLYIVDLMSGHLGHVLYTYTPDGKRVFYAIIEDSVNG